MSTVFNPLVTKDTKCIVAYSAFHESCWGFIQEKNNPSHWQWCQCFPQKSRSPVFYFVKAVKSITLENKEINLTTFDKIRKYFNYTPPEFSLLQHKEVKTFDFEEIGWQIEELITFIDLKKFENAHNNMGPHLNKISMYLHNLKSMQNPKESINQIKEEIKQLEKKLDNSTIVHIDKLERFLTFMFNFLAIAGIAYIVLSVI